MSLIAMAVHDTAENKRTQFTRETLDCLRRTVHPARHRVIVVDNGSCPETLELYEQYPQFDYLYNTENIGTAEAINRAWMFRYPDENAVKMDNDVVIHVQNWADMLEEAISRKMAYNLHTDEWVMNEIGIIGLKRKDLAESPWRTDWARSRMYRLSHEPGERWLDIERVGHVMGTCQMYSAALLEKIGFLYQPGLYGFDDALAAARCKAAGFWNAFLLGIEIDHIDPGGTPYNEWKREEADKYWKKVQEIGNDYLTGKKSVYYAPKHI